MIYYDIHIIRALNDTHLETEGFTLDKFPLAQEEIRTNEKWYVLQPGTDFKLNTIAYNLLDL